MVNKITRTITLNNTKITYIIEYKDIKNTIIHCDKKRGLYVSAPVNADIEALEKYLSKKADKFLKILESRSPSAPLVRQRSIKLGDRVISYELTYKNVKRINLMINGVKGVRVSAPQSVSVKKIEEFLLSNTDFIIRTVDKYVAQNNCLDKEICSEGSSIYYMGEKLKIHIVESDANYAEIEEGKFVIHTNRPDDEQYRTAVTDAFIKVEAERVITQKCRELYPKFKAKGIAFPQELRFKKMVSCWGNCRPARSILTFNTHLVQLPEKCIEEVICHEFSHFIHANHSKDFYALLSEFMPDWKTYDKIIKQMQNDIIIRRV